MKVLDVNVLVNAFRSDASAHSQAFDYISRARSGREHILILPEVAAGFIRIVTRRGIFAQPDSPQAAISAISAWCSSRVMAVHEAGPRRWPIFESLVNSYQLRGNDVQDALLAAAALESKATLVTHDRGFSRFEGLSVHFIGATSGS